MGIEAWETSEDLPVELKNAPHVLKLWLECLVCLRLWEKAEVLGESLAGIMPVSVSVWWLLARIRAQLGQRQAALAAIGLVNVLDASKRLEMLDDELLADVW